jgi:hypothetical protein
MWIRIRNTDNITENVCVSVGCHRRHHFHLHHRGREALRAAAYGKLTPPPPHH